jgi:hypothetical protein
VEALGDDRQLPCGVDHATGTLLHQERVIGGPPVRVGRAGERAQGKRPAGAQPAGHAENRREVREVAVPQRQRTGLGRYPGRQGVGQLSFQQIQRQRVRGERRDAHRPADLALPDADVGEAVQGHVHEPGTRHERLGEPLGGRAGCPCVQRDIGAGGRAGVREPVMAGGQRAAQVQPVRTREHAGHYLPAVGPAARAVPAVPGALAPVVLAQGLRDIIAADAAPAARPVEQVPRVEAGEPCRDRPAGRSRFPCCKLVQAAKGPADVRVGNEPVLSLGRRAVVVCPGAHGTGRFAGQHGEPFPGLGRGPRERGVKHLLHFRPRSQAGLLVPGSDRAHGDSQVPGGPHRPFEMFELIL